jgi:hypothetical protein
MLYREVWHLKIDNNTIGLYFVEKCIKKQHKHLLLQLRRPKTRQLLRANQKEQAAII